MIGKSEEVIQKELLDAISDSYQKTIGFPTYDLITAVAKALYPIYSALLEVAAKIDVGLLSGKELTRFVKQRKGIRRKEATFATGVLTVYGSGIVRVGDLFETTGGVQFKATGQVVINQSGLVPISATLAGSSSNVGAGSIKLMPVTIQGITAVNNESQVIGGFQEETDDSLRERYYEALQKPPTSGNKYHYMMWAKEVDGVGDAKVFPLWNGENTVQVVIIDADKQPASSLIIEKVQDYIDPQSKGLGEGQAPLGAYCTVATAAGKGLVVEVKIKLLSGYRLDEVQETIRKNIVNHLATIAFKQDYISFGKIANEINDSDGVEDYKDLLINSQTGNIAIGEKEVATLGRLSTSEF